MDCIRIVFGDTSIDCMVNRKEIIGGDLTLKYKASKQKEFVSTEKWLLKVLGSILQSSRAIRTTPAAAYMMTFSFVKR